MIDLWPVPFAMLAIYAAYVLIRALCIIARTRWSEWRQERDQRAVIADAIQDALRRCQFDRGLGRQA